MNILTLLHQYKQGVVGGCEYYRQVVPHDDLAKKDLASFMHINSINGLSDDEIKQYDAFQLIRKDMNGWIPRVKKLGIPVIFDIDDYWTLPQSHLMYKFYREKKVTEDAIECLKQADIVLTTQPILADKIKRYNKNVHIAPNAINPLEQQWLPNNKPQEDVVTFGWIGGVHHMSDVALLRDGMQKLWSDPELKGKFRIVLGGYNPSDPYRYMASILAGGQSRTENEMVMLPAMDVTKFAVMYDACDVMISPLKYDTFNICKSNLKIIEAGFKGKAVIGSDTPNYEPDLREADQWIIRNSHAHKDVYKIMRDIIMNPSVIREKQHKLYNHVNKYYTIDNCNAIRYAAYCSVIQK